MAASFVSVSPLSPLLSLPPPLLFVPDKTSSGFEPKTISLHSSSSFSIHSNSDPLLLLLFTVDDKEQLFNDALEGEVDNDAMAKQKKVV
jgi:hypothetical protein